MFRRFRFQVPWAARCAAAAAAGLVAANGASAFFFKGWPGDRIPRERTLVPPSSETTDTPPFPTEKPPRTVIDTPPPTDTPPGETPPGSTPEPTTAVLAAVGAGVVALARRRFRRRDG